MTRITQGWKPSDADTHSWPVDARFTDCGQSVAGKALSPEPTCVACRAVQHRHDVDIADLDEEATNDDR